MSRAESHDEADETTAVPLTDLSPGDRGRLLAAELDVADREMLAALGFGPRSRFRLCKTGNPWIVQVHGTRVGLSAGVAERLMVTREVPNVLGSSV